MLDCKKRGVCAWLTETECVLLHIVGIIPLTSQLLVEFFAAYSFALSFKSVHPVWKYGILYFVVYILILYNDSPAVVNQDDDGCFPHKRDFLPLMMYAVWYGDSVDNTVENSSVFSLIQMC